MRVLVFNSIRHTRQTSACSEMALHPLEIVRVTAGVQKPPKINHERSLLMIRFDTRGKLDALPDFQNNSR